jgi:hypothetical protein
MSDGDAESLFAKLRQMSEEGLAAFFSDVMANDATRKALGKAGERFMANKERFDRNVESLLGFVNLPSMRDVRELKSRLDHLGGQVMNLNMKLDRLLAGKKRSPRARHPARRARKSV